MNNENLKYKLSSTQREESYLWKTTHLNTAEEINKGGMKGERGRRDRRGKRRKTEAEHEKKERQLFLPPIRSNVPASSCLSLR